MASQMRAAVTLALLVSANAHMIMRTPTPFGKSTLNNSPLDASGSDFPCKQRVGVYDAEGANNVMIVGQEQTLSFTGSAVHGGGSCQISLTTDLEPTSSSVWAVIHSIEGGCPSNTTDGNLPEDPNGTDANEYYFSIPDSVCPGKYTFAWTWFNKIGNREMYMNCAPVTVRSASKRSVVKNRSTTFPAMFVANIDNGCTTVDSTDVKFEYPGDSVELDGTTDDLTAPTGSCTVASAVTLGGAAVYSATLASHHFPSTGIHSSQFATFATVYSPATTTALVPAYTSTPSSTSVVTAPNSTLAGNVKTGSCSDEGMWNCITNSTYQRCASGEWTVVQQVAKGTFCVLGMSEEISIYATNVSSKTNRFAHVRFGKEHLRRGHAR